MEDLQRKSDAVQLIKKIGLMPVAAPSPSWEATVGAMNVEVQVSRAESSWKWRYQLEAVNFSKRYPNRRQLAQRNAGQAAWNKHKDIAPIVTR